MTKSVTIPSAEYDLALAYAHKRNISMDELFVTLIRMLPQHEEDQRWNSVKEDLSPYTMDELEARIDEAEAQFERGEYVTHEQMMDNLKAEFAWLQ
jgi:hypothetical protein